jgi:hypothetical protein
MRLLSFLTLALAIAALAVCVAVALNRAGRAEQGGPADPKTDDPNQPGAPAPVAGRPTRPADVRLPDKEPGATLRPISEAESVLTVYERGGGLNLAGPGLILAAWPDGQMIFSADRSGDPPYRTGRVEPNAMAALADRFEQDGLFADTKLKGNLGFDARYHTILIRSGKRQVELVSWHEAGEAMGRWVDDGEALCLLDGRRRLEVLRGSKADWLFYRFVWSETRGRLCDLIPAESAPIKGMPVLRDGELYWREPPGGAKPDGAGAGRR